MRAFLITIFIAALPVVELRGALPYAIHGLELPVWQALLYAILGNLLPILFLYACFPSILRFVENKIPPLHRWLRKHIDDLERKHRSRYDKYGSLLLVVLSALPLPGFGVWTACVLAIVFEIKKDYAVPALILGTIIHGLIVLGLTEGVIHLSL